MAHPSKESLLSVLALTRPIKPEDERSRRPEILLAIATELIRLHREVTKQCPELPNDYSSESCKRRLDWLKSRPPCYQQDNEAVVDMVHTLTRGGSRERN